MREGGEESEESEKSRRRRLSDRTEYRLTSNENSYRKYIIKKDHNHRKNKAVLAEPQQSKATGSSGSFSPKVQH